MSRGAISAPPSGAASRSPWWPADARGTTSRSGSGIRGARCRCASARRCSTIPTIAAAMAELDGVLPWSSPLVDLSALGQVKQIGVRLRPPFPAYLAGLPLPLVPNRAAAMGPVRVLWLGPDEWLVVAEG